MKQVIRIAAGMGLAAVLVPGFAQTGPASTSAAGQARPATTANQAAGKSAQEDWQRIYRVSKIIGSDVRNLQGEKVGDIKDVVLDRQGMVSYAVVSTGGFLGMGNRMHAVPWSALRSVPGRDHRVLDIDKERLKQAPSFEPDKWPNVVDEGWSSANRRFFEGGSSERR
ncbi:PRC-barrel domain-containing protein [Aquabacterium sp.]|uniref:PRC-barrel domain-containing protein n=1 Tax=Aquabacterium sp. TaxID=1872578 RepID=UPI0035C765EF